MNLTNKKLYLITNPNLEFKELLIKVKMSLDNGVKILQYRNKKASSLQMYTEALELKKICVKYNTLFIINDRIDIALAIDADGVHLGKEDLQVDVARRLLGNKKLIGATAKTLSQAKEAEQNGANYLGVGALFPSPTKPTAISIDLNTLQAIKKSVNIPIYGIGGITENSLNKQILNNIDGISVSSAILSSNSPDKTIKCFLEKFTY